ncbi:MAG: AAA family ATPase [Bryobacteraceae bacterium]|nr:AAA family ATPase [Bryobacteraceae bacterium]
MSTGSAPKIYVCAPLELPNENLFAFQHLLSEGGRFEVFPRPDVILPGQNIRKTLDRQLRTADIYLVLKTSDHDQTWDPEEFKHLRTLVDQEIPRVLPVIEKPASTRGMGEFLQDLKPVRLPEGTITNPSEFIQEKLFRLIAVTDLTQAIDNLVSLRRKPKTGNDGGRGYFADITLENFYGFRQAQTLNLRSSEKGIARWTVILGDNGAGKTTILRALAAFSAAAPTGWRNAVSNCKIRVVRSMTSEAKDLRIDGESADHDDLRPLVFGYGAGRRAVPARLSAGPIGPSATLFDDSEELPDAEEWLLQSDHSRLVEGGEAAQRHFKQMKEVLIRILPDVTDIQVEPIAGRTRASVKMHGQWFPMASMSLGYKTALTWMVDLARRMFDRFPDSLNPLDEPVVVLIDEIDLHLHPRWQRELLAELDRTFPQAQFIITAHSPLIVQAAPNANLVLVRREQQQIVIDNDCDYVRDWRVDQILASELFGSQPIHGMIVQQLLKRRADLLNAGQSRDDVALREVDAALEKVPTAANPEDQEAMDLIRRTARLIQAK